MQITITGPRGGGSTTLAAELAHHLHSLGQRLTVVHDGTRGGYSHLGRPSKEALSRCARITIVTGQDWEDEAAIGRRPGVK